MLAQAATEGASDGAFWIALATLGSTVVGWFVLFALNLYIARRQATTAARLADRQGDIDAKLTKLQASFAVRSQVQIDHLEHEMAIYRLLWERLDETVETANFLPVAGDERRPAVFEDLKKYMVDLERTVYRNQPFYSDEIFRQCESLLNRTKDIQTIQHLEDMLGSEAGAEFVQAMFDDIGDYSEKILNSIRRRKAQIEGLPEPEDISMFPPPPPSEVQAQEESEAAVRQADA